MERDAGWYRDESGNLRYWNGSSWAGQSIVHMPVSAPRRPPVPSPSWRVPVMALGWIAAIFTLGMLLTGVSIDGMDCGYVFAPVRAQVCAPPLHERTTMAGATAAAALLCLGATSRAAMRILGSDRRANPRVVIA